MKPGAQFNLPVPSTKHHKKKADNGSNADLGAMAQNESWNPINKAVSAVTDTAGKVFGPIGQAGYDMAHNFLGSVNRVAGGLVDQPVMIDTPWLHDPSKDWFDSKGNFNAEGAVVDAATVFGPKIMGKATDLAAAGMRDIAEREAYPAIKAAGEWIGNAFRGGESAPKPPSGGTPFKGPEDPFKPKPAADFKAFKGQTSDEMFRTGQGGRTLDEEYSSSQPNFGNGGGTKQPAMSGAGSQTSSAFRDSRAPLKLDNTTYAHANVEARVKDYAPRAGQYQDSAPTITRPRPEVQPDAAPKTAPLTETRPVRESTTVAPIAPAADTKDDTQAVTGTSVNTPTKPSSPSVVLPALSLGKLRTPELSPENALQPQPESKPSNKTITDTAVDDGKKRRTPKGASFEFPADETKIPRLN